MSVDQELDHYPPVSDATKTRVRQIRDYCDVGINLFWQRQLIFVAAIGLSAYYYHIWLSMVTLILITISEVYDYILFRQVAAWRGRSERVMKHFMIRLYCGTFLSASVISFYSISIALEQGPSTHFMSLFFLFAAALFAAMNNHQLLTVLSLRLVIYGTTFLFIPVFDIVRTGAGLESELWMQFFTVLFVLYFIVDCSRIYLNLYRANRRQLEELRVEHEKTKVAYVAKTEFISTISHELRTPLTSIKGYLDLACSGAFGELPEQAQKALLISQRNSNRLANIINEILDLQKFEAGKISLDIETLGLAETVVEAIELNQSYASALGVTINAAHIHKNVLIQADESRLQQVMSNLLSNAAKFSHAGSQIRITTEVHDHFVRILVSDEGIGLDEGHREKVFEQFSQVDSSDQRHVGGSGLGLNISKRIMMALGGQIDYYKNVESGTTFFIDVPLVEHAAATEQNTFSTDAMSDTPLLRSRCSS
jgi:signal transduction histidine kinase